MAFTNIAAPRSRRDVADKSSGHRLASSQGHGGRRNRPSGIARGGRQLRPEHSVGDSRASHRGIGAREGPEGRASSGGSVEHGGICFCWFLNAELESLERSERHKQRK